MTIKRRSALMVELFRTASPHDCGLYAFLLAFVSFRFYGWEDVVFAALVSATYAFITMSIMSFNVFVDRWHDAERGDFFALDHAEALGRFLLAQALVVVGGIMLIAMRDSLLATFCLAVWVAGLWYSFIPHRYLLQNFVVGVCAASPALCGMIHAGVVEWFSLTTFALFMCYILYREVCKDVVDWWIDAQYKATLPVRHGVRKAILVLLGSLHVIEAVIFHHPQKWLGIIGWALMPYVAYLQGWALLMPNRIGQVKRGMNIVIALTLLILYIA